MRKDDVTSRQAQHKDELLPLHAISAEKWQKEFESQLGSNICSTENNKMLRINVKNKIHKARGYYICFSWKSNREEITLHKQELKKQTTEKYEQCFHGNISTYVSKPRTTQNKSRSL